jgi:signal peptidase I
VTALPTQPTQPTQRSRGTVRRLSRLITRVAAWAVLAVLVTAVAVLVVLPKLIGGQALTVETGSMTPTLPVGSVVVERPADPDRLHVGDIATYRLAGGHGLVTHRIVAIDAQHREFVFRGDANPVADPARVPAAAITGRVWFTIPYAGWFRSRFGASRSVLIVLAAIALGGYSVAQFTLAWRERSRRT